jgi:hypothetical protein
VTWKNLALAWPGIITGRADVGQAAVRAHGRAIGDPDEGVAEAADEGRERVTMAPAGVCFKRARA